DAGEEAHQLFRLGYFDGFLSPVRLEAARSGHKSRALKPLGTRACTIAGTDLCSACAASSVFHAGERATRRRRMRHSVSADANSRFMPWRPRTPPMSISPSSTFARRVDGESSIGGRYPSRELGRR